ncbi:hypothetical protein [Rathayibacter sp. AY2B5]|uniref:terminase small subunit n=1 Tax=Rathayibacter sp. AY2B5 TaxID=2080570 RepID=UPI000CE797AC|nr:hypothetical protein [Rathayibacter sp. AY2B5]PPG36324.1 hypothetical protein C5C30_16170 [Rathayibacter sp. AY2B5]
MQTEAERKAKNADRARRYRARKAAERDEQMAVERDAHPVTVGVTMRTAVDSAIAAAKWLKESDAASIAQARLLAEDVDVSLAEGDRPAARAAHRALSRVLSDLGATPSVRLLRELRSLRFVPDSTGGSDGGSQPDAAESPSNVSKFQRPEKRAR